MAAASTRLGLPESKRTQVVKVIDLGSACVEGRSAQAYVQSRFYRAPEVLVGAPYDGAVDVWSAAAREFNRVNLR